MIPAKRGSSMYRCVAATSWSNGAGTSVSASMMAMLLHSCSAGYRWVGVYPCIREFNHGSTERLPGPGQRIESHQSPVDGRRTRRNHGHAGRTSLLSLAATRACQQTIEMAEADESPAR